MFWDSARVRVILSRAFLFSTVLLALVFAAGEPALAVVGSASVMQGGRPVNGAQISFTNIQTGQVTTAKTGNDGKARIDVPAGRYRVTAGSGGNKTEREVTVDKDGFEVGLALPLVGLGRGRQGMSFGFGPTFSYGRGRLRGDVFADSGLNLSGEGDIDFNKSAVGFMARAFGPALGGMYTPLRPFFGFGYQHVIGGGDGECSCGDFHPGAVDNVNDAFLRMQEQRMWRLYMGLDVFELTWLTMGIIAGAQRTTINYRATFDERSGGGNLNVFDFSQAVWGPLFGFEGRVPLRAIMGNAGNIANIGNVIVEFVFGFNVALMEAVRFSRTTSNFQYDSKIGGNQYSANAGLLFRF